MRNGEAAGVILRVLVETPGVRPVQRAGLTAMWALVRLAGPESGVAERLVEDGFYEHLEDEWEDSRGRARSHHPLAIGGCVMQLAMGNKKMQAVLTNLGAQALVARLFKKHAGRSRTEGRVSPASKRGSASSDRRRRGSERSSDRAGSARKGRTVDACTGYICRHALPSSSRA